MVPGRRRPAAVLAALACALAAVGCGDDEDGSTTPAATAPAATPATTATTPVPAPAPTDDEPRRAPGDEAVVETIATGLDVPWDVAFLPDGRALVTERPGTLRVVTAAGTLRESPLARIDDVAAIGEGGLLGVAVDPDHERNGFVYLYLTAEDGTRIERHRLRGDRLTREATILDDIAVGAIHDAGRLRFGPDGRLYVPTGDAGDESLPRDPASRNGKILRLSVTQTRGDGPAEPEVVSSGHRNPQGLDWQPGTGRLVATEHGPDGDDEINVIRTGGDYGWPDARGEDHGDGLVSPVEVYPRSIAPSGAAFVSRGRSAWTGDLLVAALVGESVRRVEIDEDGRVTGEEALFEGELGRMRAIEEAPDGSLWALTSNTDGRGSPREGDDRLVRILPPRA